MLKTIRKIVSAQTSRWLKENMGLPCVYACLSIVYYLGVISAIDVASAMVCPSRSNEPWTLAKENAYIQTRPSAPPRPCANLVAESNQRKPGSVRLGWWFYVNWTWTISSNERPRKWLKVQVWDLNGYVQIAVIFTNQRHHQTKIALFVVVQQKITSKKIKLFLFFV